jgi:3-methyladenine DNA glycosylase/8-oxoguanine DNA glycosylase
MDFHVDNRPARTEQEKRWIEMGLNNLTCSSTLKLEGLPPYDFDLSVHKPAGWPLSTPLEVFENGTLWTVMRAFSGELFGLKLKSKGTVETPRISCEIYSSQKLGTSEKREMLETLTWILNLREDITGLYSLARRDPLVKALTKDLYGMRNTKQPDLFSRLILAVTLQMAPITRSNQMMNLLIKEYGDPVSFDGKEILHWPSAEKIANVGVRELEEKCKLGYRAKFLKDIAETLRAGFPSLQELEGMSPQEAKSKLMQLNGIGEYSADIVLPHSGFALDVWSAKIFNTLLLGKKAESPRDLIPKLKKIAEERWGNWRGYVFIYVLNDLDNLSRRFNLNLTQT